MKTITEIIRRHGGLAALKAKPIHVTNPPYMPLAIEYVVDAGLRGLPVVSVAHHYLCNDDLMRDPEMVFEVSDATGLEPLAFRRDPDVEKVAVWRDQQGCVMVNAKLIRDLRQFMRLWDKNIREQGFVEVYKQSR